MTQALHLSVLIFNFHYVLCLQLRENFWKKSLLENLKVYQNLIYSLNHAIHEEIAIYFHFDFHYVFLTQSRSQFSNENHWLLLQIRKDFSIAVPTKESCKILSN